jgi:hypothetical protein
MPENRPRNYTIAILLILLGVVLLLQQLGIWQISWASLWQLWPLALVFIGLEMLLRRVPMGGLIYLLLVAVILAGVWFLWPSLADRWGRQETQTVELSASGISSAQIEIAMGVGELEVAALQEPGLLYRATLHHDPRRTELIENEQVRDGRAEVSLEFRGAGGGPFVTGDRGRMEIGLARDIPLALRIETGVSKAQVMLSDLTLARLDLQSGVGDSQIALPGGTYEVTVQGGVGALEIQLPQGVGAQIEVEGGLGAVQVADRFRPSAEDTYAAEGAGLIRLRIQGGIGTVRVR